MKKTLVINAALVAGILAASAIGTVHAGSTTRDYQIGYQNGYAAGANATQQAWLKAMKSYGICGSARAGTNLQVWHYGIGNRSYCNRDRLASGWYSVGNGGGTIAGDTVCWYEDGRQLTLVMDSGTMSRGIGYCNANEPK